VGQRTIAAMAERASTRRTVGLAIASLAVVVGHRLAYELAFPDASLRAAALRSAGHGYLAFLTDVAILCAGAGAAATILSRITRPERPTPRLAHLLPRLALAQAGAFVGMELVERLVARAPLGSVAANGLLPIGVAVQLALALVVALAVRALDALGDRAASAARSASLPSPRAVPAAPRPGPHPPTRRLPRRTSARAPPAVAA